MNDNAVTASAQMFESRLVERGNKLMEKWAAFIDSPKAPAPRNLMERYQLAVLLENAEAEAKQREAAQTTGAFGTAYTPAVLGMTRQIFPRLIGLDLVGVQPLDRPTGKVFHLTVKRDDDSEVDDFAAWEAKRSYADFAGAEASEITTGMKFSITSSDVTVGTPKKLLVEASMELAQDLQAYHGLNANDILQAAAVDEVAREIDAILVKAVYDAATAHKTVTFGQTAPAGYTATEWAKKLQRAILIADNEIYKKRGVNATFLVCGSNAALELMDLNSFVLDPNFNPERANYGLSRIGTFSSQYNVFRCQYVNADTILVGRKGASILDAGLFYMPYVPLFISERQFDNRTQSTNQSFMSRYTTYTASNEYFAKVVLNAGGSGIS